LQPKSKIRPSAERLSNLKALIGSNVHIAQDVNTEISLQQLDVFSFDQRTQHKKAETEQTIDNQVMEMIQTQDNNNQLE